MRVCRAPERSIWPPHGEGPFKGSRGRDRGESEVAYLLKKKGQGSRGVAYFVEGKSQEREQHILWKRVLGGRGVRDGPAEGRK